MCGWDIVKGLDDEVHMFEGCEIGVDLKVAHFTFSKMFAGEYSKITFLAAILLQAGKYVKILTL
jgi:hypothetical protein